MNSLLQKLFRSKQSYFSLCDCIIKVHKTNQVIQIYKFAIKRLFLSKQDIQSISQTTQASAKSSSQIMTSFKSPQLQICGKISSVFDPTTQSVTFIQFEQSQSFYLKIHFIQGEQWKLISGKKKFQTFQSQSNEGQQTYLEHPFSLHYITTNMRGWPRILAEVWKVDRDGRHNIYGYGTVTVPFATGEYRLQIPCWRPMGTWYDRFVGSNAQLQYPAIIASSLNRYGLRTFSGCKVIIEVNVIGRNFQLHGVVR